MDEFNARGCLLALLVCVAFWALIMLVVWLGLRS